VISLLLYGAETWILKAPDVRRLTTFHNRCVWTLSRFQIWQNHINTQQLPGQFGLYWLIANFVLNQQSVWWLGYLGCMSNDQFPKQLCLEIYRRISHFMMQRSDVKDPFEFSGSFYTVLHALPPVVLILGIVLSCIPSCGQRTSLYQHKNFYCIVNKCPYLVWKLLYDLLNI